MGGNNQSHFSMVTTSMASTAPPTTSAPDYCLVSTNSDIQRRTAMAQPGNYYLKGFESMVELDFFTIKKKKSWIPFRNRSIIRVFDQNQTQILSAKELEKVQGASDGVQRLLQCTDGFHQPLFSLSTRMQDSDGDDTSQVVPLISNPVDEETLLGYIKHDQSTFQIMNIEQRTIITAKLDSKPKTIAITTKLHSSDSYQERQVGSVSLAGSTIKGNVSKDLDIGLKACIIAMAIYRLLRRKIFL